MKQALTLSRAQALKEECTLLKKEQEEGEDVLKLLKDSQVSMEKAMAKHMKEPWDKALASLWDLQQQIHHDLAPPWDAPINSTKRGY